jgi:hypothetical protein
VGAVLARPLISQAGEWEAFVSYFPHDVGRLARTFDGMTEKATSRPRGGESCRTVYTVSQQTMQGGRMKEA